MAEPNLDISVVVPVRNGGAHISSLLHALESQTLARERFEVIVVDDCSTDDTSRVLSEWAASDPPVRRVVSGPGRGPGAARNAGVALARGGWIAFTDSDTTPDPEWLRLALDATERTGALAIEGSIVPWPKEAVGPYTHQARNEDGGRYMTANMIYSKSLLDRLGGFDPLFEQFLEDSDLAFRAMDSGVAIPFAAEVTVRHAVFRRSVLETLASTRRLRFIPFFAAKHPERYRTDLRRTVRPLTRVDVHVLVALVGAMVVPLARKGLRVMAALLLLNGIRVAFLASGAAAATGQERIRRLGLGLSLPPARAWWWLEGSIRLRLSARRET